MSAASPAEMQRLLAAEFERRGWDYDIHTGREIVERAVAAGRVDATQLSAGVPAGFLTRARTSREVVADAIERAIGGATPRPGEQPTTIVINDHRYSITQGAGAQITGSALNLGGTQVNVNSDSSKEELLAGLQVIIRAAIAGDWNEEAVNAFSSTIDGRNDIGVDDVAATTVEVLTEENAQPDRMKDLLYKVAATGFGGALSAGLSAGVGEAISRLAG